MCVQYTGDIQGISLSTPEVLSTLGDVMSTPGGVKYSGGYHDYSGGIP